MKRIGLLIPSLNSGGAERVVSRLSFILSQEHEVYVIVFDGSNPAYQHGGALLDIAIPTHKNIFTRLNLPVKRALALRGLKLTHKLDVVISFMDSPNVVNTLSKIASCKTIISVRGYESVEKFILKLIGKLLYNGVDGVVAVSKVMQAKLHQEIGIQEDKLVTIYNPFSVSEIMQLAQESIASEYAGFFGAGIIFISVGRQVYQKGYWHLIKAFNLVHKSCPDAKLVIIGRDEMHGKCLRLVNQLGLQSSCLVLGYQQNPFKYLANSSVYVLSSLYEGFPNALVEAMASGCAVIAADCMTGPREILSEDLINNVRGIDAIEMQKYGVLVPPLERSENWDPSHRTEGEVALAKAMVRLASSPDLLLLYSALARERAAHFSYERCAESYNTIIRGLYLDEKKGSFGNI